MRADVAFAGFHDHHQGIEASDDLGEGTIGDCEGVQVEAGDGGEEVACLVGVSFQIVEFGFVCAPDGVVQAVMLRDKAHALVRVAEMDVVINAGDVAPAIVAFTDGIAPVFDRSMFRGEVGNLFLLERDGLTIKLWR